MVIIYANVVPKVYGRGERILEPLFHSAAKTYLSIWNSSIVLTFPNTDPVQFAEDFFLDLNFDHSAIDWNNPFLEYLELTTVTRAQQKRT